MAAPKELTRLVENFDRNLGSHTSAAYNEAQVRAEFIDPMFELLGWDVQNKAGNAEAYKDVIHEDAIQIGGTTKAPDYCFRIGGTRKFFLEAKKPSVSIKDEPTPAYQLRRYAWSAKLPLSILSDFAELAVYDCRVKPEKTDKPAMARINYLTYDAYPSKWDEIATVFSKDAVLRGSFDRFAGEKKGKKGTAAVDAEFLREIERWRELLARNIALRNPRLSIRELNEAVQRTIDRIVFLRICEDRGIETQYPLQGLQNGTNVYPRLFELFQRADERYNSGLFHFQREKGFTEAPDTLTPGLKIDDKLLQDIIANLYYPDSPYEFSVLPADILGQVYEQFLGKVIRLTAGHRAVVEDKPEVKKAGGVYYTPTYIVAYIVEHTVGKLLEGKTPKEAADLKILDPACGSGSFLLGAYQRLLDWHRDWYVNDGPDTYTKPRKGGHPALFQAGHGEWRLTTPERKRILLNSIFGVDIDPQAVEVTKLSLLLKVLEGESDESISAQLKLFHERALPDLGSNIKCGNSFIGSDFSQGRQGELFDDEEALRVNPFDWDKGFPEIFARGNPGFDAVIGNPPYIQLSMEAYFNPEVHSYLSAKYSSSMGRMNTFGLFIERSLGRLLRQAGQLSFIVPNTLLSQDYYQELRRMMLAFRIASITGYEYPVFQRAVVETCVFVVEKAAPTRNVVEVVSCNNRAMNFETHKIPQATFAGAHRNAFLVRADSRTLALKARLDTVGQPLEGFANINQAIALKYERARSLSKAPTSRRHKRVLDGRNINRYQLNWDRYFLEYDVSRIHSCKRTDIFEAPEKILFRRVGDRLIATYDDKQYYALNTLVVITLRETVGISLKYILGLLNSQLLNFYYVTFLKSTKRVFSEIQARQLGALPFRVPTQRDSAGMHRHDRMVDLVNRMLALHTKLAAARTDHERTVLQRQTDATDREIDTLVYKLYGLTEEEIRIVEEATT